MKREHNSHRSDKLERYMNRVVKVIFKSGHGCIGKLGRLGWKYAVYDCTWSSNDGSETYQFQSIAFCHSNVRRVEVLK